MLLKNDASGPDRYVATLTIKVQTLTDLQTTQMAQFSLNSIRNTAHDILK